jgi:hypothetical protein
MRFCKYNPKGHCLKDEKNYEGLCVCDCPHNIKRIKVIATCVTCETTVTACETCKIELEQPKTEC